MSLTLRSLEDYGAFAPTGTFRFIPLAEASCTLPKAPSFIFGPITHEISTSLFGEYALHQIGCYLIKNASILVDGIVVYEDNIFEALQLNHPDNYVRDVYKSLTSGRRAWTKRRVPGSAVLLFGPGYPVYGHWLTDFLPRLFVLDRLGFNLGALRYVIPKPVPSFIREMLRLIGLRDGQIIECETQIESLQFDELILPTNLRRWNRLSPLFCGFVSFLLQRITGLSQLPAPPINGERIFLSRRGTDDSRLLENRDEIEATAAAEGLTVVRPSDLPLLEQISMFREAKLIVGEYGSALHNSIFAEANCFVMALRTTTRIPGFIQSGICHVLKQEIGYVFGGTHDTGSQYLFTVSRDSFLQGLDYLRVRKKERGGGMSEIY